MGKDKNVKNAIGKVEVPQEQIKYANLLLYGSWLGIAILIITFFLYVTGILVPYIEPAQMPQYWGMRSSDFLHAAGLQGGWEWLGMLEKGDFINYVGIALLAALTVIGYLVLLLPAYIRKKDYAYTAIVITEIIVLVLAASGILGSGGH